MQEQTQEQPLWGDPGLQAVFEKGLRLNSTPVAEPLDAFYTALNHLRKRNAGVMSPEQLRLYRGQLRGLEHAIKADLEDCNERLAAAFLRQEVLSGEGGE